MKRIISMLLVVACVAVLGISMGCKKKAAPGAVGEKGGAAIGGEIKIAMIGKSTSNPVFPSAKVGAEAKAAELSKALGMKITIDWLTPPQESGEEQAARIGQAVNTGAAAILISCSDANKLTGAINDAVGRGVQVMTFDSDAPDSKRFAFYGVDDIKTGEQVMDELAKAMGGKGNIAILAGNQNAPNLQKRVKGVKDTAAAKYPGIKVVDVFYHTETPQDAASKVSEVNKAHPEINGWAMIGGWPLFTKTLLTEIDPAKMKVVAVDALPAELPYVDKGITPVLLAQPTYNWGYISVGLIIDKIVSKKEVPVINPMELVPVTKDNLGTWARQLKAWGFEFDADTSKFLEYK